MNIHYNKYLKKRTRILNEFSGCFMSNSQWLKLLKTLSKNHEVIHKCFITHIYDERRSEFWIPPIENFDGTFHESGINDGEYGPLLFKEIKSLEFPAQWLIQRKMGDQTLQPFVYSQNLNLIQQLIVQIGKFVIDKDDNCLKIYGYK